MLTKNSYYLPSLTFHNHKLQPHKEKKLAAKTFDINGDSSRLLVLKSYLRLYDLIPTKRYHDICVLQHIRSLLASPLYNLSSCFPLHCSREADDDDADDKVVGGPRIKPNTLGQHAPVVVVSNGREKKHVHLYHCCRADISFDPSTYCSARATIRWYDTILITASRVYDMMYRCGSGEKEEKKRRSGKKV